MQAIPHFFCEIVDQVASKELTLEAGRAWSEWSQQFLDFLDANSDFSLSEYEARLAEELPYLYKNVDSLVSEAMGTSVSPELLLDRAVQFFEAHDAYFQERANHLFVQDDALEDLLKACLGFLHGRAELAVLERRLPKARMAVRALEIVEFDFSSNWAEQAADALSTIEDLVASKSGELARIEQASIRLKDAIASLENEIIASIAPPDIPIISGALIALEQDPDEETLHHLKEVSWPEFLDYWERRSDGWLLPAAIHDEFLSQGFEILEKMGLGMDIYSEEPDLFWGGVEELEDWFRELPKVQIQLDELDHSPFRDEAQLLVYLLQGRSPRYAAFSLSQSIAKHGQDAPILVQDLGRAIEEYLNRSEPKILLNMLERIVENVKAVDTALPQGLL